MEPLKEELAEVKQELQGVQRQLRRDRGFLGVMIVVVGAVNLPREQFSVGSLLLITILMGIVLSVLYIAALALEKYVKWKRGKDSADERFRKFMEDAIPSENGGDDHPKGAGEVYPDQAP